MAKIKIASVVTKIVELLEPLSSEERSRAVRSVQVMLGEEGEVTKPPKGESASDSGSEAGNAKPGSRAKTWMRQNTIKSEDIEQVFHITDDKVEVIASEIPGKGAKGKTLNAYLLEGISKLLSSDSPTFDDKDARHLCKTLGCYNNANHSVYMAAKGNRFTGAKDRGWTLTGPGLTAGASLIKEIAGSKNGK